jgi:Calcium-activated chloride channel
MSHSEAYGTFVAPLPQPAQFDLGDVGYGEEPAAGWDYVFQFDAPGELRVSKDTAADQTETKDPYSRQRVLAKLRAANFAYSQLWIPAEKCVLVRFALSEQEMKHKAEHMGWEGPLKDRYGAAYLAFTVGREQHFANDLRSREGLPYFHSADRVLITLGVLRSLDSTWGAGIDVDKLTFSGSMKQAFAVHIEEERAALVKNTVWAQWWNPTPQLPLLDIKNYLGARVALYFGFLSFYARMLLGIGLFSLPVHYVISTSKSGVVVAWARFLFGIAIVYWSCYFLILWQRRNAVLNVQWGLDDFQEDAENDIRPQFQGELRKGFFCKGGFVDLADMAGTDASSSSSSASSPSSASLSSASLPPRPKRLSRILDAVGFPVGSRTADGKVNGANNDTEIIIGGGDDVDFKLSAVLTGVQLADLPTYPFFSKQVFQRRLYASAAVTFAFAILILLATFMLLYFKLAIIEAYGTLIGRFVPGILTGLLISISDVIWSKTALKLTHWENHRTSQSFDNSLIYKRFAFSFCSCYSSLFYIAFVKPYTPSDPCTPRYAGILDDAIPVPDCMAELETQLVSLLLTKATVQQLVEVGVPLVNVFLKNRQQRSAHESISEGLPNAARTQLVSARGILVGDDNTVLAQSKLARYKGNEANLDFVEMVLQFGFISLFAQAAPIIALINLINNIIETRTDAFKILVVSQRTDAADASDIGSWLPILEFMYVIPLLRSPAFPSFKLSRIVLTLKMLPLCIRPGQICQL